MDVLLAHMPDNQIILFIKGEIRFHQQMQLREIEVILLAFIPEHTQQSAIQWDEVNLRSTSANIEYAVLQQLPGLFASQATGGEPDPGGCEIPAPVLIRVSETFFRCDNILLSIQDDCSAEGALHAFRVPVHGKGLCIPERLAGTIANIEGHLFVYGQVPGHSSGIAHTFRMCSCLFRTDPDVALQLRFAGQAICRFNPVRRIPMDGNILPGKESMKLAVIFSPGTGFDHQVRRELSGSLVLRQLAEDRFILRQGGIAGEELNEKRFVLSGFRILRCEGMPPPVISMVRQRAMKHERIPVNIMMIKHKHS